LDYTDADEQELVCRFSDSNEAKKKFREARELGEAVFDLLNGIGAGNEFFRHLVV
jgi:hypothetical protein